MAEENRNDETVKNEPLIRKIWFSLKFKITALVFFVLIFTVSIIANFIIERQNRLYDTQLVQNTGVYLERMRMMSLRTIFQGYQFYVEAGTGSLLTELKDLPGSFSNIPHFRSAGMSDVFGNIITYKNSISRYSQVPKEKKSLRNKMKENFEENEAFLPDAKNYIGIMPVYFSYEDRVFNPFGYKEFVEIRKNYKLYKNKGLFGAEPLSEEVRNNLAFYFDFRREYSNVENEKGELSLKVTKLLAQTNMTEREVNRIKRMNRRMKDLVSGKDVVIDIKTFNDFTTSMVLVCSKSYSKKLVNYTKMLSAKKLFANTNLISPKWKKYIEFYFATEDLNRLYLDEKLRPTSMLRERAENSAILLEKRLKIDKNAYASLWRKKFVGDMKDLNLSLKNLRKPLIENTLPDKEDLNKAFVSMFDFYRLGTAKIVLDKSLIEQKRNEIINNTIDIALMFILRMLFITFLIVTVIVAPLKKLGDGTDMVSAGKYDTVISLKQHDELGQLADKFNIMTGEVKEAIEQKAEKARMEKELEDAQEIQEALLPKSLPEITGYGFASYFEPMSESGGDYYDFIEISDNLLGIVVADVTNHGVGAAMVTAVLRSVLRDAAPRNKTSVGNTLKAINPTLYRDTPFKMFATVFYGVLDQAKKDLYYTSAGHEKSILLNTGNNEAPKLLLAGGIPLGATPGAVFDGNITSYKISLKPGDIFIQYTDGITEAKNEKEVEYGDERFIRIIGENRKAELEDLKNILIEDVKGFCGKYEQSDDITLVILKVE